MQVPSHVELKFTWNSEVLCVEDVLGSSFEGSDHVVGPVCDWIFEKFPHLELEVLWLLLCVHHEGGWFCLAQVSF